MMPIKQEGGGLPIHTIPRTPTRYDDVLCRGSYSNSELSHIVYHDRLRKIIPSNQLAVPNRPMPYSKDALAVWQALKGTGRKNEKEVTAKLQHLIDTCMRKFPLRQTGTLRMYWSQVPCSVTWCHQLSAVAVRDFVLCLVLATRNTDDHPETKLSWDIIRLNNLFVNEAEAVQELDEVAWIEDIFEQAKNEESMAHGIAKLMLEGRDAYNKSARKRPNAELRATEVAIDRIVQQEPHSPEQPSKRIRHAEPKRADPSRRLLFGRNADASSSPQQPMFSSPLAAKSIKRKNAAEPGKSRLFEVYADPDLPLASVEPEQPGQRPSKRRYRRSGLAPPPPPPPQNDRQVTAREQSRRLSLRSREVHVSTHGRSKEVRGSFILDNIVRTRKSDTGIMEVEQDSGLTQ